MVEATAREADAVVRRGRPGMEHEGAGNWKLQIGSPVPDVALALVVEIELVDLERPKEQRVHVQVAVVEAEGVCVVADQPHAALGPLARTQREDVRELHGHIDASLVTDEVDSDLTAHSQPPDRRQAAQADSSQMVDGLWAELGHIGVEIYVAEPEGAQVEVLPPEADAAGDGVVLALRILG
jgi:hypothetical protein